MSMDRYSAIVLQVLGKLMSVLGTVENPGAMVLAIKDLFTYKGWFR